MSAPRPRILVVGAGAVGGYFGGRLALGGRDVTFLVRAPRAAQLRERGLRLHAGEERVVSTRAVLAGELDSDVDLVLLTVKATTLASAISDLAPAVGPETLVVPLLNGMAHLDALQRAFGEERVAGGVARLVTTLDANGDIVQLAPVASLAVGALNARSKDRLSALAPALDVDGFELELRDAIEAAMWEKWVFIATIGALTCLFGATIGELVAVEGGAQLGPAILEEAAAIARAAGFPVSSATQVVTTAMVTEAGSTFVPSLARDVAARMPSEAEHIVGDLVRRARVLGVATPLLDLALVRLRIAEARIHA